MEVKIKGKYLFETKIRPVLGVSSRRSPSDLLLGAKYSSRVFMKFGVGVLYEKSSTVREFRDARLNVSRNLLKGVIEI